VTGVGLKYLPTESLGLLQVPSLMMLQGQSENIRDSHGEGS
jgi:hypothetical protein